MRTPIRSSGSSGLAGLVIADQRVASGVVAIAVAAVAIVFLVTTLHPKRRAGSRDGTLPPGTILYGEWDQRTSLAHWYTIATDGSQRTDLGIDASCAAWFPDGGRILFTNDAEFTRTSPLRPAVIDPDGSNLRPLDAVDDPDLNLGCGDVSPDGTRIVLEGLQHEDTGRNGIYTVRASDGGGLVRLTSGFDGPPSYSPDGSQVVFMRTRPGIQPDGAGALFVVDADGGRPVSDHALGRVVPRQRLVSGRRVDRVPAPLRAALPRASRRQRPAPHPRRAAAGRGSQDGLVVARRRVDRVLDAGGSRGDDLGRPAGRLRPPARDDAAAASTRSRPLGRDPSRRRWQGPRGRSA